MVQGHGVALKGRVPVGLGGVPRVSGIGGQAKIGETQVLDDRGQPPEFGQVVISPAMGVYKDQDYNQQSHCNKQQVGIRFSQHALSTMNNPVG